jgi:hypothetical protein
MTPEPAGRRGHAFISNFVNAQPVAGVATWGIGLGWPHPRCIIAMLRRTAAPIRSVPEELHEVRRRAGGCGKLTSKVTTSSAP